MDLARSVVFDVTGTVLFASITSPQVDLFLAHVKDDIVPYMEDQYKDRWNRRLEKCMSLSANLTVYQMSAFELYLGLLDLSRGKNENYSWIEPQILNVLYPMEPRVVSAAQNMVESLTTSFISSPARSLLYAPGMAMYINIDDFKTMHINPIPDFTINPIPNFRIYRMSSYDAKAGFVIYLGSNDTYIASISFSIKHHRDTYQLDWQTSPICNVLIFHKQAEKFQAISNHKYACQDEKSHMRAMKVVNDKYIDLDGLRRKHVPFIVAKLDFNKMPAFLKYIKFPEYTDTYNSNASCYRYSNTNENGEGGIHMLDLMEEFKEGTTRGETPQGRPDLKEVTLDVDHDHWMLTLAYFQELVNNAKSSQLQR